MIIYGVAILAGCSLVGWLVGDLLGQLMGVQANIGGVGFAMLLLIAVTHWLRWDPQSNSPTMAGVQFWSAMYVPIVVAMAATQNVAGAITGGGIALLAGGLAVFLGFVAIAVLIRRGAPTTEGSRRQESKEESP